MIIVNLISCVPLAHCFVACHVKASKRAFLPRDDYLFSLNLGGRLTFASFGTKRQIPQGLEGEWLLHLPVKRAKDFLLVLLRRYCMRVGEEREAVVA